jgi:hypothetical protein
MLQGVIYPFKKLFKLNIFLGANLGTLPISLGRMPYSHHVIERPAWYSTVVAIALAVIMLEQVC